jgi:hypothetical protein
VSYSPPPSAAARVRPPPTVGVCDTHRASIGQTPAEGGGGGGGVVNTIGTGDGDDMNMRPSWC